MRERIDNLRFVGVLRSCLVPALVLMCLVMTSCATLVTKGELENAINESEVKTREEMTQELTEFTDTMIKGQDEMLKAQQQMGDLVLELSKELRVLQEALDKVKSDYKYGLMRGEEAAKRVDEIDSQLAEFSEKLLKYFGLKSAAIHTESEAVDELYESLEKNR